MISHSFNLGCTIAFGRVAFPCKVEEVTSGEEDGDVSDEEVEAIEKDEEVVGGEEDAVEEDEGVIEDVCNRAKKKTHTQNMYIYVERDVTYN